MSFERVRSNKSTGYERHLDDLEIRMSRPIKKFIKIQQSKSSRRDARFDIQDGLDLMEDED